MQKSRALILSLAAACLTIPARAKITIDLDYSLDSANFFNPNTANGQAARAALLRASQTYTDRIVDNLSAITPGGVNTWTTDFTHPGTGTEHWAINNLSIPAGSIKVYVGARNLSGNLGLGGPGGYGGSGDANFATALTTRGQAGATSNPSTSTDFGPWGGSISFDNTAATKWNFSITTTDSTKNDFLTIATHELAHILGFGTAASFNHFLTPTTNNFGNLYYVGPFTGPKAKAQNANTAVPLEVPPAQQTASDPLYNAAHFASTVKSTVAGVNQLTIMGPEFGLGDRRKITPLDFAAIDDIGWDLAKPGDANADGTVDFNDLVVLAQNYNTSTGQARWSQGDFNYDGNVNFNDLVSLAQNYNTSGIQGAAPVDSPSFEQAWLSAQEVAAVPEPATLAFAALAIPLTLLRRNRRH